MLIVHESFGFILPGRIIFIVAITRRALIMMLAIPHISRPASNPLAVPPENHE